MSKRTTTSAARQMLALNDCKVFDQHQWHATFTVGQYLYTTCGTVLAVRSVSPRTLEHGSAPCITPSRRQEITPPASSTSSRRRESHHDRAQFIRTGEPDHPEHPPH